MKDVKIICDSHDKRHDFALPVVLPSLGLPLTESLVHRASLGPSHARTTLIGSYKVAISFSHCLSLAIERSCNFQPWYEA